MAGERERLRQLIEQKCLITSQGFTLTTGGKSGFYFDCKAVTLEGEGLALIASEVLREIEAFPKRPTAIGGMTMGADFIAAAVALLAYQRGLSTVHGSIVRKEPKKHGTMNKIENQLPIGTPIVVVDDVITSGSSTIKACEEFTAAGYEIVGIIAIVDREAGGKQRLEQLYGHVRPLFQKSDFFQP
jgi:orotate phosphoribosyltransferase